MPSPTSVLPSDFSEDEFQALAFAELAQRFRSVVVGGPYIEDRRAERRHGVDAWLAIRAAGKVRPLFFQFKKPQMVVSPKLDPACAALYGGVAYLRFSLHKDSADKKAGAANVHRQHNNLVALRMGTGYDAYYCSPAFIRFTQLLRKMYRGEIFEACLLGDPLAIGFVTGRDSHHLAFAADLSGWSIHSEATPLGSPTSWANIVGDGQVEDWTAERLDDLSDEIERILTEHNGEDVDEPIDRGADMPSSTPADRRGGAAVLRLAHVARAAFGGPVVFVPRSRRQDNG